jgi:hypothetical protein
MYLLPGPCRSGNLEGVHLPRPEAGACTVLALAIAFGSEKKPCCKLVLEEQDS